MSSHFSENERDRRWEAVRHVMTELGLECLVTAPGGGLHQPDSTYLMGRPATGRTACVVPRDDAPMAMTESPDEDEGWGSRVSAGHGTLAEAIVERVQAVAPAAGRIGVTGLRGRPGAPDGTMPAGLLTGLESAFPNAELVDVSHELRALRAVKSEEEMAVLAAAARLADRAVDRVATVARPGATDLAAWGAMVAELVRGGSDPPTSSRWGSGLRPLMLDRPPHAELQRGTILVLEPEARIEGYRARVSRPLAIEACDAIFRDLCALQAEYWQACFELLKPGRPIADLFVESAALAKQLAARPGRYEKIVGSLALAGCGLGLDAPTLVAPPADPDGDEHCLLAGCVFELVAPISLDIGPRILAAGWSDVVAIEAGGPRRLGSRAPGWILIS